MQRSYQHQCLQQLFGVIVDTTHCHLWMFLFDILLDSNKSNVATWEDQKGMFRIRDPTKLADMWGEKRNRTNMTYEKLSRSLRHYYEKKILRKVPKRKYTYKFNSREILKSYEVQPYYRRSTSNSQAQRNAAAHANQAHQQLAAVYQAGSSSGQCSPYTPVTPSPSYHQHHAGFNWNHVQAFSQGWTMGLDAPQMCHQQPSPAYHTQTSMAGAAKQWGQPMQIGFSSPAAMDHQMTQSPMAAPAVPTQYRHNLMQASPTSSPGQPYPATRPFMTELQTSATQAIKTEEKPNLNYIMENIDTIIGKSKITQKPTSPPSISAASSTTYSAAQNALYNQNNSNSNQVTQTRCRSHSVNSYESSSPDSYYSNDAMFNDIMESLVMEAF